MDRSLQYSVYLKKLTKKLKKWQRNYTSLHITIINSDALQYITVNYTTPSDNSSFGSLLREIARQGKIAHSIRDFLRYRYQLILPDPPDIPNTFTLDITKIKEPIHMNRLLSALNEVLDGLDTQRSDRILLRKAHYSDKNIPYLHPLNISGYEIPASFLVLSCIEDLIDLDTSLLACDYNELQEIASYIFTLMFSKPSNISMSTNIINDSSFNNKGEKINASYTNLCEHIFSELHLASNAKVIDPLRQETFTYRQLKDKSAIYVNFLNQLRLRKGDIVALIALDSLASIALMLACFSKGLIFAPINEHASITHIDSTLNIIEPCIILLDNDLPASHYATLKNWHTFNLEQINATDDCAVAFSYTPCVPDTPAVILCTSGSTGTPKAVMHSHADFINCHLNYGRSVLNLHPKDRVYTPSRIFFTYGLNNLLLSLLSGVTHVISAPLGTDSIKKIGQTIRAYDVTVFLSVPTIFKMLLVEQEPRGASLRLCVSTGETLPARLYREIRDNWNVEIIDGIGCTETLSTFISNRPNHSVPGSTGTPVPGFHVKLINQEGKTCRIGEVGSLWVNGNTLATGYISETTFNTCLFSDGWFNTNDLFFVDVKGRFHNVGRKGTVIKINGCWFSPKIMETVIHSHPYVKECAICVFEDEFGLPRPVAFVVLTEVCVGTEALWNTLRTSCRNALGKYHYPHHFTAINVIPQTTSGKVLTQVLLEILANAGNPSIFSQWRRVHYPSFEQW